MKQKILSLHFSCISSLHAAKQRGNSFCTSLWIMLCESSPHFPDTGNRNEPNIAIIFSSPPLPANFQLLEKTGKSETCLPSCSPHSAATCMRRHVAIDLQGNAPVASLLPDVPVRGKAGDAINSGRNPSCWQAARDSRAVIAFGQPRHRNYSHSPRTLPLSFCFLEVIANNITWIQIAGGETQTPSKHETAWPET